jgi:hypothetical protein
MVKTVNQAFKEFLNNYVNLDPGETESARKSRNWLVSQIHLFPSRDINFPTLFSDKDIFFGSFARCTKKRELDDIDIMIALSGEEGYYNEFAGGKIKIYVNPSSKLKAFCHEDTNILNSRKIVNKFVSLLKTVPQYEKAKDNIKRNLEAATLKLKTRSWNFDIVPCFFTQIDLAGKDYYLIPDGNGNWKKTDPRIDQTRVTKINQKHGGNILNLIRLMKYWNERPTMSTMPSYLLENMILNFYSTYNREVTKYVDLEVPDLFNYIKDNIFNSVDDPKGIQGDINSLSHSEKLSICGRAHTDYLKSLEARQLEDNEDHKTSIMKWREIFGYNFPIYS